jgi:hypothetical protein
VKDRQPINELKLNLTGKIFFATMAAWLVGKAVSTKLRGTPEQMQAVMDAMMASKKFQDELNRPGATVDSVVQKLGVKHMSASQFEKVFGIPWPL